MATTNKNPMSQKNFEWWLILSCFAVAVMMVIFMCSEKTEPWMYLVATIAAVNLLICVYKGS